jgi:hypothetical protein
LSIPKVAKAKAKANDLGFGQAHDFKNEDLTSRPLLNSTFSMPTRSWARYNEIYRSVNELV